MDGIRRAELLCGDEVMGRTRVLATTEAAHGQLPEPLNPGRQQLEQTSPAKVGTQPDPHLASG